MADDAEEIIISFGDLNIGEMYPIHSAVVEQRKFGDKIVDSVKIGISSSEFLKTFTYLPSGPLKSAMENIKDINEAATKDEPYSACYYGAIISKGKNGEMKRYIGRVHPFGAVVNEVLLADVAKTNKSDVAKANISNVLQKRASSDLSDAGPSDSPAKMSKSD